MAKVEKDKVVSLDYTLTLDSGDVIDSSEGREPLQYLHGHGTLIPGLERELEGMEVGEEKHVDVSPADGYGERTDAEDVVLSVSDFPPDLTPTPGMGVYLEAPNGEVKPFFIKAVVGDKVLLNENHPLAGETLHFDVKIKAVRDATEEELEHGHAH